MKPPEQVRRELVQQWLAKATEDLTVARHLLSEGLGCLGAIGFHAQQAAEKYLKALLVAHQIEFPKTHDLGELLDLVASCDDTLAQSLQDIAALNPYGVDFRYPGDAPQLTPEDARHAVELATRTQDTVLAVIESKT